MFSQLRLKDYATIVRQHVGAIIRGGEPILQDLSMQARRDLWPAAADLKEKHVRNCQLLANRDVMMERMPKNAVCAELGIAECVYSDKILRATDPRKLHLFDIDPSCIDIARDKFGEEIAAGQVCVHLGNSSTLLLSMPDRYFDWVYIDGDHTHEGAKRDLEAARLKLKDHGLIALNDYTFFGPSDFAKYGVMEAVHDFCIVHEFEFIFLALQGRGYHDVALRQL
jgi:spermidine synthase